MAVETQDRAAPAEVMPDDQTLSDLLDQLPDSSEAENPQPEAKATRAEPDADEPEADADEAETEAKDETEEEADEAESEEILITLDNKELKLPKGTPAEVVETLTGLERDLRADYTRKTQEQSERIDRRAEQVAQERYAQTLESQKAELQKAQAALPTVAGYVTPQQMQQWMNQIDPSDESQRQQFNSQRQRNEQIEMRWQQAQQEIGQLDQRLMAEKAEAQRKKVDIAWLDLNKAGISKPDVEQIYNQFAEHYGVDPSWFESVEDATIVIAMKDANAYRELQKQTKAKPPIKPSKPAVKKSPVSNKERTRSAITGQFQGEQSIANLGRLAEQLLP